MKRHVSVSLTVLSVLLILMALPCKGTCDASGPADIPAGLQDWTAWVLHGMEDQLCPTDFNDENAHRCSWPTRLTLHIEPEGGRFEIRWLIFSPGWVNLPGTPGTWPAGVTANGEPAPVMERNDTPSIRLLPGTWQIKGSFKWTKIPEMIHIPAEAGLVTLFINGKKSNSPFLDPGGRLWLQKRAQEEVLENRVDVRLFRLLNDTIPMNVTSHLDLSISGQAREITLENMLPDGSIPMRLDSPLPARLGADGQLLIQARPGRWAVRILSRFESPIEQIEPVATPYGPEIWSFQSQNHLRMVKLTGAAPVEPGQTDMPEEWKQFPAYIIEPDSTLKFTTIRRGDPDPAPDRLTLQKTWWLDFDGTGYTIQDTITGTMSRQWSLWMNPPTQLGRVSVDGKDQLITARGRDKKPGVELRRGSLHLEADSRLTASITRVPAVGWDHGFESVSGILNLPPGWRLLSADGVDVLPGTWFQRWTLLDFFVVLMIALSIYKLKNRSWGLLALATLVLIYHEAGSPRLVWLHIVAALALSRILPDGWFKKVINLWAIAAVVVLLATSIPFMVHQIRTGIYPQLEKPGSIVRPSSTVSDKIAGSLQKREDRDSMPLTSARRMTKSLISEKPDSSEPDVRTQAVLAQDPNALIQTGPGLPDWRWNRFSLKWNGPVHKDQSIRLWFLSPAVNLALAFVRVLLLAGLISGFIDPKKWRQVAGKLFPTAAAGLMAAVLILSPHITGAQTQPADFPPPDLLKQLQERLLEPPDCLPNCASIVAMDLNATADQIRIQLDIHAACQTAVPLPGALNSWMPQSVLLDDHPAQGLSKTVSGTNPMLWALVPEGIHRLILSGSTGGADTIHIPLPLPPRHTTVSSSGWTIKGVHPDGRTEAALQLTRAETRSGEARPVNGSVLPPFLHVGRTLHLGLSWQISTVITRLTPTGTPVVLSLPLIPGESVTTSGIQVENRQALINFGSEDRKIQFLSDLEMAPDIELSAPGSTAWAETWILDASPVWHCEFTGIPAIHHQNDNGQWRPEWRPWPKEQVSISISRPEAIPGQIVTIDSTHLEWTPGQRFNKAALTLSVRTSRGGQHPFILPDDADLQLVKINNQLQPIRQENQKVIVPLKPGAQTIRLEWHQPAASSLICQSPPVHIGEPAVNADITFHIPRNRWILWAGGPRLGPAVLFWSYLIVVLIAAAGLSRVPFTPLKMHHWLLLGLGLTQVHPLVALIVVGWLIALGLRKRQPPPEHWAAFNATQVLLFLWTTA
ncbi:MAG: hypothetical protein PHQ97_15055, partial [Desulfobacterales bacterium]|nr:hypothetical protein [Desulfobacterales bacterium]